VRDALWNVVCFSSVDWDYNRQRPQWVMSGLADRGASVLFVDNLGLRLPRLSDAGRVARRLKRWAGTAAGPRSPAGAAPRIRRDAPLFLPVERPRVVRGMAFRALARRIGARAGRGRPLVVWTYSPHPVVRYVARTLRVEALVFDWADDASEHLLFGSRRLRHRVAEWETRMLEEADLAIVASAELLRRRTSPNPRTVVIPHGVPPSAGRGSPPPEVAGIPRPRIGFVGTVSDWLDLPLLEGLARARPSWSFVLVGPVRTRSDGLRRHPNIVPLGSRPHPAALALLSTFDVALIPYRLSPAISVASPVKLGEYMAHGVPVVSVDLPEVRPFAPRVRIAEGVDGFLRAIEDALAEGRQVPHRGPSWEERVDEMVARVSQVLEEKP
jgi:glycosyltransferase involved in cell wall biosynthesis